MKFPSFVLVLAVLTSFALTGCATDSQARKVALQIYQPRVLSLRAGQSIQTTMGTYVPQTDEIWHSPQAFDEVELKLIDATEALDQIRNK